MRTCLWISALIIAGVALPAGAEEKPDLVAQEMGRAKQLFERFMKLESNSDPAVADLYSDRAKILNSVRYEDGMSRIWEAPAPAYKEAIRKKMAAPAKREDRNTYTNLEYTVEGTNVRINAICLSRANQASNPTSFLVGPDDNGKWVILVMMIQSVAKGSHVLPLKTPPAK